MKQSMVVIPTIHYKTLRMKTPHHPLLYSTHNTFKGVVSGNVPILSSYITICSISVYYYLYNIGFKNFRIFNQKSLIGMKC